jgi:hypothetical protein
MDPSLIKVGNGMYWTFYGFKEFMQFAAFPKLLMPAQLPTEPSVACLIQIVTSCLKSCLIEPVRTNVALIYRLENKIEPSLRKQTAYYQISQRPESYNLVKSRVPIAIYVGPNDNLPCMTRVMVACAIEVSLTSAYM